MRAFADEKTVLLKKWLPEVHRALAHPDEPKGIPSVRDCRELFQAQVYWECLEYLFGVLIGWQDIGAGLAWWYGTGKDTQGDDRLELVRRHWDDQGQLEYYAAHHWRACYSYDSSNDLSPTDLSIGSRYPNLEWWRSFKARGMEYAYDPFYKGTNPLHLEASSYACLRPPSSPPTGYRSNSSVEYPSGVVITNGFHHWRNDLRAFAATLPPLNNRSWRIEVFDRQEGYLGLFRNSRDTGQWFQGRHGIHAKGNDH